MLTDILKNKKCFKLVCGAGNEDTVEVEKLVTLYSKAGCKFFDISAKPEIVDAAKRALKKSGVTDAYLCVSVGIKGDPHISKACINKEICTNCGKCISVCSQSAILKCENTTFVNKSSCIGCGKCVKICPVNSIDMYSEPDDLKKILSPLIEKGIDCIEFHALSEDEDEILKKWSDINSMYSGLLSICVDRSRLGNIKLFKLIDKMLSIRTPYTTIIQADGAPMSGGIDDYKSTLQAVATAEIFQKHFENDKAIPCYILLSGGTNSKSLELANLCNVNVNGVAVGSYARKIVKEYVKREDFLQNEEIFSQALKVAKSLVDKLS